MKHDFRHDPDSAAAAAFLKWLEAETTQNLAAGRGDAEQTKSSIFLFANRAYEANMSDSQVAAVFAKSLVHAGFTEEEEEPMFEWLEAFADLASKVHGDAP
jgi:hypothetical protein